MKISRSHITLWVLLLTLLLAFSAGSAHAVTPANTRITNTATVNYKFGGVMRSVSASVSFIVSSVDGLATISTPPDQTTAYAGTSSRHNYNFMVTASGNGPANFTVATYMDSSSNTSGAGSAVSTANISLGSSVTIAGSTTTVISLPADGASNSKVNGIGVGSLVQIAGETRIVAAVNDPASGTATITLDRPLPASPGPGIPVFEQKVVALEITAGAINNPGVPVVVKAGIRVTGTAGTSSSLVTSTFTSTTITLVQYVRNASNPKSGNIVATGAKDFTIGGNTLTFYSAGVTAQPGDILEYLLVATNSGTAAAINSVMRDTLSTQFATHKVDSYSPGNDLIYQDENGAESRHTFRGDSDIATLNGSVLTINVGSGATSSSGGSLAVGKEVRVAYQVTVNQ